MLQIKISVEFLAPHYHVTAFPLALLIHLELDQNQFTSHRQFFHSCSQIRVFKVFSSAISPSTSFIADFLYPPLLCPHFASSTCLTHMLAELHSFCANRPPLLFLPVGSDRFRLRHPHDNALSSENPGADRRLSRSQHHSRYVFVDALRLLSAGRSYQQPPDSYSMPQHTSRCNPATSPRQLPSSLMSHHAS